MMSFIALLNIFILKGWCYSRKGGGVQIKEIPSYVWLHSYIAKIKQ